MKFHNHQPTAIGHCWTYASLIVRQMEFNDLYFWRREQTEKINKKIQFISTQILKVTLVFVIWIAALRVGSIPV